MLLLFKFILQGFKTFNLCLFENKFEHVIATTLLGVHYLPAQILVIDSLFERPFLIGSAHYHFFV